MKGFAAITTIAAGLTLASPALAGTGYLLDLGSVDGTAGTSISLDSWSFGVCNVGQCSTSSTKREAATGKASGKSGSTIQASQNSQSLRESPSRPSVATGVAAQSGDIDGDGVPDFAFAATQDAVYGMAWTVDASPPSVMKLCEGKHIAKANLRRGDDVFEISDAAITCSVQPPQAEQRAGINRIDSTPARISTNLTVAKQTQQSSFGERCQSGMCAAGSMTITVTSGQMKHTKTGHVTLLK